MLGGDRLERVNELVRTEVGDLLQREVEVPPGVLMTVTKVETSPDLEHARVWISILPSKRADAVLKGVQADIRRIQHLLNKRLVMESVPRLRFLIDGGGDRAEHLERLLDTLDEPR